MVTRVGTWRGRREKKRLAPAGIRGGGGKEAWFGWWWETAGATPETDPWRRRRRRESGANSLSLPFPSLLSHSSKTTTVPTKLRPPVGEKKRLFLLLPFPHAVNSTL